MEKEENYSGFLCKKCNFIPFIQIIPRKNKIKIFSSCNCCKHYEDIDVFTKNKYQKNIKDKNRINKKPNFKYFNKNEEKINIEGIINNLNVTKEALNKNAIKIKDEIIGLYKMRIEEIKNLYENYTKNNNKIALLLEQLINSYKSFKDNLSNTQNILNNCSFNKTSQNFCYNFYNSTRENLESLFKIAENYFNNNYIITNTSIKEGFNKKYFSYNPNHVINFIELENNLCAACFNKNPEITIYDLTSREKEKFSYVAHLNYVNWIIYSSDNNLISCGSDGFIKIWPNINEQFQIGNSLKVTNNTKKRKFITLNPIYVYKCENKEMKGIIKMIGLSGNRFIAANHAYVFLFKYTIKENNINIEFIKNYACFDLIDINSIKKDNNEIIVINSYNYLSFLNIPTFETISKIRIASIKKNNLIQINSSELLILQGIYFTIFDLNKYKIKLTIKNKNNCDYLLNLNDGTILQTDYYEIKRFIIKTMEELPILLNLNNDCYDDEYYNYYYDNYDNKYIEKLVYIYKLKDGRVVLCYENGTIDICDINFI